ncbi:ABC transporter permease [Spiribacter halobius]|uniref:ABC transporter permease n=1 Tax=Sediminicurvatus halobius TaxID=2182432 RepID=UPI0018EE8AF4|nr:iron ABC transporter permease [Spiribacter halobius]UEX79526.1 iron ABC transporter permease [Spiribacter halobius]
MSVTARPLPITARVLAAARRGGLWTLITTVIAALVALPVLTVLYHVFVPAPEVWSHLATTVLPRYLVNTAGLAVGVGIGVLVIGVGTAWLVVMCRFPGRRLFEWSLLLPLAVPTYVIAYAYTDFLQYAGPLQSMLRELFGWTADDYTFPPIRSLGGAIALLSLVLYPYVYLLTRAAFLEQSVCVLEVGRTLGRGPWKLFGTIAIPLARPAIVGGVSLALMETLNEFGAVQFFAVDTFTTGIYRTWFGLGERTAAAQLAACLLIFVLVLLLLERFSRGRAQFFHTSRRYRELPQYELAGMTRWLATLACALPVLLGFLLPAALLVSMTLQEGDARLGWAFLPYIVNSVSLAGVAAAAAVLLALLLAYGVRMAPSPLTTAAARISAMGYAVPGAVIAVGILIPLGWVDRQLYGLFQEGLGWDVGLLLTGTAFALVYAYLVRFLAVSYNAVQSSLTRVTPGMDAASRTLGKTPGATLRRVHAPIMRGSLFAAGILVFVDVMKELPATIILRPFDFTTLAVRSYELASDERLSQSSTAALAVVLVGVLPVILLSRAMRRSRPGSAGE